MDQRTEHMGFTVGIKNPTLFGTPNKAQLLFRLQTFDETGRATTTPINSKADVATTFHTAIPPQKNFVIYWPLCYGNPIYTNPETFKRLLQGVIKKLKWPKPYKVHFIFVDTGELHRHNLAKDSLSPVSSLAQLKSPAHSPRSSAKGDLKNNSDSPRETAVTQLNEKTRWAGINLGNKMIRSLQLVQIAAELDCIIDVITWGEVKDPLAFRALIKRIVKNDSDDPENLTSRWEGNDIHNLSLFVAKQYSEKEDETEPTSPTFTRAVSPILLAQSEKDAERFGERFNFKRSHRAAKFYLFEEESHMILVNISISDLIDAVIQPETLGNTKPSPRNRKFYVGEKLNEWVIKLSAKRLGCKILDLPKPYRYLTIEIPRDYYTNQEDCGLSPRKTADQHTEDQRPPLLIRPHQFSDGETPNLTSEHSHILRQKSASYSSFFDDETLSKLLQSPKKEVGREAWDSTAAGVEISI